MKETNAIKGKVRAASKDGLTAIDISHKKIHDGRAFAFICEKSALASGASCWIYFLTNSSKEVHFRPSMVFSTDSLIKAELYEKVTYTAESGTAATVFNHNRRLASSITTDMVVKNNATITGGTRLPFFIPAGVDGSRQSQSGGPGGAENEWLLEENTAYGIKVTNLGSASTDVTIVPFWYEVDYL